MKVWSLLMRKYCVKYGAFIPLALSFPAWSVDSFYSGQVGTDVWMAETQGSGAATEPSNVPSLYIAFEHQLPFLPNLAFHYTNLFEDDMAYDRYSYVFYYPVLNTDLYRVDSGFKVSRFKDGSYLGADQQTYHFNATTVTFHSYGEVAIPYMVIDAFAEMDIAHLGGDNVRYRDMAMGVQWQIPINMGTLALRAGYRDAKIELRNLLMASSLDDPKSMTSSGVFLGAKVIF